MRALIPHFIYEQHLDARTHGSFGAAALFVDIAGFTSRTETLMQYRRDGAEVLTELLNNLFDPLVSAVYANGGFITTFVGDAFTALFPMDSGEAASQAARTASFIQHYLDPTRHGIAHTRYGDFVLGVKIGLGAGQVEWRILGREQRKAFYFRGSAIEAAIEAEKNAATGEVITDESLTPVPSPFGRGGRLTPSPFGRGLG